jgi:ankyrin repeat protein
MNHSGKIFLLLMVGILVFLGLALLGTGAFIAYRYWPSKNLSNLPSQQPLILGDLQTAFNTHNAERFSALLDRANPADPEMAAAVTEMTASAASDGDIAFLRIIFKHGFSLQVPNLNGDTPIHIAASHQANPAIYEFLVKECGISCELQNAFGDTPLLLAARNGDIPAISKLLSLGASFTAVNAFGQSALHLAAEKNHVEAMRMLLHLVPQMNANARDKRGRTPLHIAVEEQNVDAVKFLVALPADLTMVDAQQRKPADTAKSLPAGPQRDAILQALGAG